MTYGKAWIAGLMIVALCGCKHHHTPKAPKPAQPQDVAQADAPKADAPKTDAPKAVAPRPDPAMAAGPAAPVAAAVWEGGAKFDRAMPVALAVLTAKAAEMADKQVQIEGTVSRVCQGRGCWVEVKDGSEAVIAKSLNDSVLFPKDCVGKKVLVQGLVRVKPAQQCDMKGEGSHEGERGGAGGMQGHDCPKPEMLVEIQGARLY